MRVVSGGGGGGGDGGWGRGSAQQQGYKVLFSFLLRPKYKSRCRIHAPSCFPWLPLQTSSPVDDTHGKEPMSTLCSSLWGAEG